MAHRLQSYFSEHPQSDLQIIETGTNGIDVLLQAHGAANLTIMGLLKKAASGVLAIFPCSRTQRTLRASKRLRSCRTDFFEPTRSL
ncbi:MAG: hypothetical protein NPIRA03_17600 [Nitrospirales bacterium]|nr:MAG: hypothetical protein NPIRA03_17600 [Nitrospirales bacterium]